MQQNISLKIFIYSFQTRKNPFFTQCFAAFSINSAFLLRCVSLFSSLHLPSIPLPFLPLPPPYNSPTISTTTISTPTISTPTISAHTISTPTISTPHPIHPYHIYPYHQYPTICLPVQTLHSRPLSVFPRVYHLSLLHVEE